MGLCSNSLAMVRLSVICLITLSSVASAEADEEGIELTWDSDKKNYVYSASDDDDERPCQGGRIYPTELRVLEPFSCSSTWIELEDRSLSRFNGTCITRGLSRCFPFPSTGQYRCGPQPVQKLKMNYACENYKTMSFETISSVTEHLCPQLKQILLTSVYLYTLDDCRPLPGESLGHGRFASGMQRQRFNQACNGKVRCDVLSQEYHEGCSNKARVHSMKLGYICQRVGDISVFNMAKDINKDIVDGKEVGLVMSSSGSRECHIYGNNAQIRIQMLYVDLNRTDPCHGWVTIHDEQQKRQKTFSCFYTVHNISEISSPAKTLFGSQDQRGSSSFKVAVSVTSGLVWMQLSVEGPVSIDCHPLFSDRSQPVVNTTHVGSGDDDDSGIDYVWIIVVSVVVAVTSTIIAVVICACFFCCMNSPLMRWANRRQQQHRGQSPQQEQNELHPTYYNVVN